MGSLADAVNSLRTAGRAGRANIASLVIEKLVDACRTIVLRDRGVDDHAQLILILADLLKLKSEFVLLGHPASQERSLIEGIHALDGVDDYARSLLDVLNDVNAGTSTYRKPKVRTETPRSTAEGPSGGDLPDALLEALARIVERVAAARPIRVSPQREAYLSIQQVMRDLHSLLKERGSMRFEDVFEPSDSRERIVLTFLAILILTKTGVVRISQHSRFDDIIVEYVGADHD